jgi:hypothetical protein
MIFALLICHSARSVAKMRKAERWRASVEITQNLSTFRVYARNDKDKRKG